MGIGYLYGAQIYCLYAGLISGLEVMSANSAVMLGIIGFYFNSRRNEKINAKKDRGGY